MKVGIFFRKQVDEVIHIAGEIIHFLKDNNVEVFIDDAVSHYFAEPSIGSANLVDFDFLVSIGGDGTFLQASHIVLHSNTPLIGVNYGFTGFLTSIEEEEVLLSLQDLIQGQFYIENRSVLEYDLIRDGESIQTGYAANDLVIQRKPMSKMISLDVFADKQKISNFRGDGLIISTPTGSTAYSLSAGGPILDPQCHDIIINPLCPHKLSNRSLVIPDNKQISASINCKNRPTLFIRDGISQYELEDMDRLQVQKSAKQLRIIHLKKKNFFEIVNHKFQWGL